ncbi:hypothetical protein EJB05_43452, partial [Eragrostis curvula]
MLVYEFIPNDMLFHLLHRSSSHGIISLTTRLEIMCHSVEALASLSILHIDIKSSNILIDDDDLTAKVSDFSASVLALINKAQLVTIVQGTCGYLDPEYMWLHQTLSYGFTKRTLKIIMHRCFQSHGRGSFKIRESQLMVRRNAPNLTDMVASRFAKVN